MKVFLSIWLSRLQFERLPGTPLGVPTKQGLTVRVADSRVIVRNRFQCPGKSTRLPRFRGSN